MESKLHPFASNLGETKADKEKCYFDIASVIEDGKIHNLSDIQRKHLIHNRSPTTNFEFPVQTFPDKPKKDGLGKLYYKSSWFSNRYNFIAYSKKRDGIFCLHCLLFSTKAQNSVCPCIPINEAYQDWKDISADLKKHRE